MVIKYFNALHSYVRRKNYQRLEKRRQRKQIVGYPEWVASFDSLDGFNRSAVKARLASLKFKPVISIVMPVFNPDLDLLQKAIKSVKSQYYKNWELCIADDASTNTEVRAYLQKEYERDARIRVVFRPENGHISACTNSALGLVSGTHVGFLDQDDILREHALVLVAEALNRWPKAKCIYSDEDKLDRAGKRADPNFKPDWNPELLLGQNYIGHFCVLRRDLIVAHGGLRVGYEGAQDHDLLLRCLEKASEEEVIHIPHILYHWRVHSGSTAGGDDAKAYAVDARLKAVQDCLDRSQSDAIATNDGAGLCKVVWKCPEPAPRALIVIPTRNCFEVLRCCVDSVLQKTDYPNFEVVIVDNGSDDPDTLHYLEEVCRADARVSVRRDDGPFNYSALNNAAVQSRVCDHVVLLNNDVEVITPGWLTEMIALSCRPGVGAVGARLWYPDDRLQHGGVILLGQEGIAGHAHKLLARGQAGYMSRAHLLQSFSAVTAACLAVRRKVWDEVGGLDEVNLRVAFNDVDFCLRVREHGYRNLWTPHAELYHYESLTRGADDTPEKKARFQAEVRFMSERWGALLDHDPAYSPYFCLGREDMMFAPVPRVSLSWPWYESQVASREISEEKNVEKSVA